MYKCNMVFVFAICMFFDCIHSAENTKAEVKKQKVGDIDVAYYTRGAGEPLILIMGYRGTMAMWDPAFIEALAKNYTVLVFDNRGAGLSTDSQENHTTIQQMAKDTAGLIRSLGYKKVHLLGWSMGTSIALQLALEDPPLLQTLILCSPNPGGKHQSYNTSAFNILTSKDASKEALLSVLFPDTPQGRQAGKDYMDRLEAAQKEGSIPDDLVVSQQTIDRQTAALRLRGNDETLYEGLPSIKMPTLVAGGLKDVIDPSENVRSVANRIPFAWAAYFPDSGHAFTSQDYIQFSRLIDVFIKSNSKEIYE